MGDKRRILFRADSSREMGTGHVVRAISLAEEALARGDDVLFVADLGGVQWLEQEISAIGPVMGPPPGTAGFTALLREVRPDAVVVDAYHLPEEHYSAAREIAVVLAVYDGVPHAISGDVLLDQNVGSDGRGLSAHAGSTVLRGSDYVLLSDRIRKRRPAEPPDFSSAPDRNPAKVLVVMGGTDPMEAGPRIAECVLGTGLDVDLTLVTNSSRTEFEDHRTANQRVRAVRAGAGLAGLMCEADVVVSGAGTSTWELCCLARPAALLRVVDNQIPIYDGAVGAGCAAGLGSLADLTSDPASVTRELRALLLDRRRLSLLAENGWKLVDGDGRGRVLDVVHAHLRDR